MSPVSPVSFVSMAASRGPGKGYAAVSTDLIEKCPTIVRVRGDGEPYPSAFVDVDAPRTHGSNDRTFSDLKSDLKAKLTSCLDRPDDAADLFELTLHTPHIIGGKSCL